jgi:gliding motility-associated-like protein
MVMVFNDTWVINDLDNFTGCTIQIFTRLGREICNSIGYSKAWDGTLNGKPLHLGVFYYVITLNNNTPPVSGFVVIVFNAEWPLASQAVGYWQKNTPSNVPLSNCRIRITLFMVYFVQYGFIG